MTKASKSFACIKQVPTLTAKTDRQTDRQPSGTNYKAVKVSKFEDVRCIEEGVYLTFCYILTLIILSHPKKKNNI